MLSVRRQGKRIGNSRTHWGRLATLVTSALLLAATPASADPPDRAQKSRRSHAPVSLAAGDPLGRVIFKRARPRADVASAPETELVAEDTPARPRGLDPEKWLESWEKPSADN